MPIKAFVKSIEEVPEAIRGQYNQVDGGFALDVEGIEEHPGTKALKKAKDVESRTAAELRARVAELAKAAEDAQNELETRLKDAVPKDNLTRLEQSWAEKMKKQAAEMGDQIAQLTNGLQRATVTTTAQRLATELAAHPTYVEALLPHITSRLKMEVGPEGASIRVLDADGKPSAATLEDFAAEIRGKSSLAPLLSASRASGGSANGATASGSSGAGKDTNILTGDPAAVGAQIAARLRKGKQP